MHGLYDIVQMNSAAVSIQMAGTPCEADELLDITKLIAVLESGEVHHFSHGTTESVVALNATDAQRAADYLRAAYGVGD